MSLLSLASSASAWRGYDYYKAKKVHDMKTAGDGQYEGRVSGSGIAEYHVRIDLAHPRSSSCSCPHASGRRIICKHMVATYFSAFPEEAENFYREVILEAEAAEEEAERQENAVISRVFKMKRAEAQEALLQLLFNGPDWQYERFIREYLDEHEIG